MYAAAQWASGPESLDSDVVSQTQPVHLRYPDADACMHAVADTAAESLRAIVQERGRAVLACSGGTTPVSYLPLLAERRDVPWADVVVTLTDDRFVPASHPDSNARLVRAWLLEAIGPIGGWLPLVDDEPLVESAAAQAAERAAALGIDGPDVTLLGMGLDGHIASLFPGLVPRPIGACIQRTCGAPGVSDRVTWSMQALAGSELILLPLVGQKKAMTFRQPAASRLRPVDLIRQQACGRFVVVSSPRVPLPPPPGTRE